MIVLLCFLLRKWIFRSCNMRAVIQMANFRIFRNRYRNLANLGLLNCLDFIRFIAKECCIGGVMVYLDL